MTQTISLSRLGSITKISQGGQGTVYKTPPNVTTDFADSMVFKEYHDGRGGKPNVLATINVTALKSLPAFLESFPRPEGAKLISIAAWPCRVVEDSGVVKGFVMPSIPDQFFITVSTAKGSSRIAADFQQILNSPEVIAMRLKGRIITDREKYELLKQVASALAFLHSHNICVGDISPKNLLFSLSSTPAIYFIDCDAMRVNGVSLSHQLETPGWEIPTGEELATPYSDRYKLALLALRLIVGDQDTKSLARLPSSVPADLRRLITDTLNQPPKKRPELSTWESILDKARISAPKQATTGPVPAPANRIRPLPQQRGSVASQPAPPPTPPPVQRPSVKPYKPQPQPVFTGSPQTAPSSASKTNPWLLIGGVVLLAFLVPVLVLGLNGSNTSSSTTTRTTAVAYPETTRSTYATTPSPTYQPTYTSRPTYTTRPPAATQSSVPQPYWSGYWVMNYWEDEIDCANGTNYWVVQPGTNGMFALKRGCFPPKWRAELLSSCRSASLPPGQCAVWDPDRILSEYQKRGNIQVVALTQACLDRAGLSEFHQGPLHQDCVVAP